MILSGPELEECLQAGYKEYLAETAYEENPCMNYLKGRKWSGLSF